MSSIDLSSVSGGQSANGGIVDDREFGQRIRIVQQLNPYMAQHPEYLSAMASSPYDTETLVSVANQAYAMQAGDGFAKQLQGLGPATQRAIMSRISPGQQAALSQLGYQAPARDNSSMLGDIAHVLSQPLGVISKGFSAIPGASGAFHATMEGLTWVGNWPGHLYRTIETMDSGSQLAALGGAALGIAAVLAAPVTGGASLGTLSALGLLGGGALGGATAAAALSNPNDWGRAFSASWNGERTFRQESLAKANRLLTDPRAQGIAADLSAHNVDPVALAKELAGHRETDRNSQLEAIYKLAGTMAAPNSDQYKQAVTSMLNAMQDPTFQQAVQELNNGKISPGRDLASTIGLDPGSTLYNIVSGATDATFTIAVDPTLMLGYGTKLINAKRFTFEYFGGAEAATAFRKFVTDRKPILRTYERLAEAVEASSAGGLQRLRSTVPQLEPLYNDLVQYRQALRDTGKLNKVGFSSSDVIEYLTGETNFRPLLEGIGSVKNANGLQLYAQSAPRVLFQQFRNEVRSLVAGMADVSTEAKMVKLARIHGVTLQEEMLTQVHQLATQYGRDFQEMLPVQLTDMIGQDGLIDKPWRFFQGESGHLYSTGRAFADKARTVPVLGRAVGRVGEALTAMTTMAPAGRAISLTGDAATKEIRALTELGRYMGLPSYFRHAWADVILSADSPSARYAAAHGWLANMLRMTGIDATPEGKAIVDEYLVKSRQLFGADDMINVNGHKLHAGIFLNEQADKLVMPSLHEMRKAAVTGPLSALMGVSDLPYLEPLMTKFWKPLVLLRLGFIPRAAGEELASFMLRGGLGSFTQEFGARFLGNIRAYEAANRKVLIAEAHGMDPILTKLEQKLIDRGLYSTLPAHVRPIVRMAARAGFEDPVMHSMLNYRDWLQKNLTSGFGFSTAAYGTEEANRLIAKGAIPLTKPKIVAHNFDRFSSSILMGKEYSIRRMLIGGVNDDLVEAGQQWASGHATQVMRHLSATNNGPIDPGFDNSKIHTVLELDPKTKEMRPVVMMTERGVRQTVGHGDPFFETATLEAVQRPLAEPAFRDAWLEHGTRITGGVNVGEAELAKAADSLFAMGRTTGMPTNLVGETLHGAQARLISRELLASEFSRDHWEQMIVELRRSGGTETALALESYLKDIKDPTLHDVTQALLHARTDIRPGAFANNQEYMAARKQLDNVRQALETHAAPAVNWLDSLPLAEREFAAQFLDGQLAQGNKSFWSQHAPGSKFLYRDLDEARPHLVEAAKANVLNPNYHDFGVPKSLRGGRFDETGQFTDTELKDATVLLYQAPDLRGLTFQQVLDASDNHEIIQHNADVINGMLNGAASHEAGFVADVRLADELARVDARLAGVAPEAAARPRVLRQERKVTDGRMHGQLRPDLGSKASGTTQLWYYPKSAAEIHTLPMSDVLSDPAQQWAEDMVSRFSDVARRGTKQVRRARTRVGPPDAEGNPTQIPVVHRYRGGKVTPIGPEEDIALGETKQLVDYKGDPIHYGDNSKLTGPLNEDATQGGDVMWEMVSPATRDAWAEKVGGTRMRRKRVTSSFSLPGKPVQSHDLVTIPRAKISDVRRTPMDDLPQHAISEVYSNRKVGNFDRFVQFGFDHVIGPSIDAVVRRPMAFHHYANRYVLAKKSLGWTLDPELIDKVSTITRGYGLHLANQAIEPERLADLSRTIAAYHGETAARTWGNDAALAWLRGHTDTEISDLLAKTIAQAGHETTASATRALAAAKRFAKEDIATIRAGISGGLDHAAALDAVIAALPGGARSLGVLARGGLTPQLEEAIGKDPFLQFIHNRGKWGDVAAAHTNLAFQRETAGEIAATAAVSDAMPFIDSHEFKTQFADYAQGYVPFWYAEENFMKRWARGLADEGPAMIRKAQLGYMGMKQAGVIRTDQAGRDWFVYPGSGLLVDTLSKIPGMSALQSMGIMFQTPTDSMLPGLNNRFGVPSFNPLVTLPMDVVTTIFPELEPAQRAMLGDFVSGRGIVDQLVPAHLRNLYGALFQDESTNQRYASAMSTAIAWATAHGKDPGPDATPSEVQDFLDMVRKHARIIVVAQAIGGFIVPGSPSEIAAGRSANIAGVDVGNPADYLSAEYVGLVRSLGIEAGTQKYLELNDNATLDGIINPLAYTVPRNVSTSGAPIPATEAAFQFMQDNADYFAQFPNAAPWLFPQDYSGSGGRSQYAYDQQVADGMRDRRTPEELLDATYFKLGAQEYFAKKDYYMAAIEKATIANDKQTADKIRNEMDWQLDVFRTAHPKFAEQLESSDGRIRRQRIISEMRNIVDDPLHPTSEQTPQMQPLVTAMRAFDIYTTRLSVLQNDHSNQGRREIDHLKEQYSTFMSKLLSDNPSISSFWTSVLKPESSL